MSYGDAHPRGDGIEADLDLEQHGVVLVPSNVGVDLRANQGAVLPCLRDVLRNDSMVMVVVVAVVMMVICAGTMRLGQKTFTSAIKGRHRNMTVAVVVVMLMLLR